MMPAVTQAQALTTSLEQQQQQQQQQPQQLPQSLVAGKQQQKQPHLQKLPKQTSSGIFLETSFQNSLTFQILSGPLMLPSAATNNDTILLQNLNNSALQDENLPLCPSYLKEFYPH